MEVPHASPTGQPCAGSQRRALLLGAAAIWIAPISSLASPAAAAAAPPRSCVLDALEACGVVAENPFWVFEVNDFMGQRRVMFSCGDATGPGAGRLAAQSAILDSGEATLRAAPGAALVVRGRYPEVLTHREAFDAYKEVRRKVPRTAYVLYALMPDENAGAGIEVGLGVAMLL